MQARQMIASSCAAKIAAVNGPSEKKEKSRLDFITLKGLEQLLQ